MKLIRNVLIINCILKTFGIKIFNLDEGQSKIDQSLYETLEIKRFDGDFTNYLEEIDHNFVGFGTPIFISRLADGYVVYDQAYYPKENEKVIKYQGSVKRAVSKVQFSAKNWKINSKTNASYQNNQPSKTKKKSNFNTNTLKIVYPEILVVVDYETYKFHNGNPVKIATYMSAFWNGVDLRFRELRNPQIRLNIAGLVINRDKNTEPYLKRDGPDGSYRDLKATLLAIGKHFNDYELSYDAIVVITQQGISKSGRLDIPGISFNASACKRPISTAIIKDHGGFEGIITAAHELGHIFGALDDVKICPSRHDYIMDHNINFKNNMHWSDCSIRDIQEYLRSADAYCLRNKPDVVLPYQKKLPGKLLTRDQQCAIIFPGHKAIRENFFQSSGCGTMKCENCFLKFFCYNSVTHSPPAEGSVCGNGHQFCIDGNCIDDPKIYD